MKGKIKNPQTLNLYSYCLNNPLRYVDPSGLSAEEDDELTEEEEEILKTLREIFSKLFNIDPDELGEDLDDLAREKGGEIEALAYILGELGFDVTEVRDNEIDVSTEFGDVTFKINNDMEYAYGLYWDLDKPIELNCSLHTTVADLATTILHEFCHYVIEKEFKKIDDTELEHHYIYKVQLEYMNKLTERAWIYSPWKGHGTYPYSWIFMKDMRRNYKENVIPNKN